MALNQIKNKSNIVAAIFLLAIGLICFFLYSLLAPKEADMDADYTNAVFISIGQMSFAKPDNLNVQSDFRMRADDYVALTTSDFVRDFKSDDAIGNIPCTEEEKLMPGAQVVIDSQKEAVANNINSAEAFVDWKMNLRSGQSTEKIYYNDIPFYRVIIENECSVTIVYETRFNEVNYTFAFQTANDNEALQNAEQYIMKSISFSK